MSWDNFKLEEFACKHCGENKIEHELIDKLQALRTDCERSLAPSVARAVTLPGGSHQPRRREASSYWGQQQPCYGIVPDKLHAS